MTSPALSTAISEQSFADACRFMPGGVNSAPRRFLPHLVFRRAAGAVLIDVDGNQYIDYHGGFGAAILGHNHPEVNRRVAAALETAGLPGAGTTELEIELAQKICRYVPSAEKVLFCTSGSQATFHAVRVARAFTGRKKIIKFQGCYHGIEDSLLRNVASPREKVGQLDPGSAGILPEVLTHTLVCDFNDLDGVERTLAANLGEVAAIILEPIAHNVGCILPRPGFLPGLRELATAHGAVLIFDEVITGFRHHLGGYQAICGVTPDLTALGKAIANGYPMAAVCGRAEIMDHFSTRPGGDAYFAGTYNGNAIGCAAALATIEILERDRVHEHIFRLGERLRRGLAEIHQRLGTPATVAGFGSIFVTYFMHGFMDRPVESYTDLLRNDAARFVEYRRRLIDRGIFTMPLNLKRDHVSYSHTDAHIDRTLEVCEEVLTGL
ncbi:MAG: aspartate aminotransferase family protein [Terriglobia bacterium]